MHSQSRLQHCLQTYSQDTERNKVGHVKASRGVCSAGSLAPKVSFVIGPEIPAAAKRFAAEAGSFAEPSLAAAGLPGGQAKPHTSTSPGLHLAISRFSILLFTPQPCLSLPVPGFVSSGTPSTHTHSPQNVQARPQSSSGFGLCCAQGTSASCLSPAPKRVLEL